MAERLKCIDVPVPPPWRACNEHQRRQMYIWVNAKLDEIEEQSRSCIIPPIPPECAEKYRVWRQDDGLEKLAAWHGHVELLRLRHPGLAEFLQPRKLKRGEKYPKTWIDAEDHAVNDAGLIRQIWQKQYGRSNRRADDGPSAVQIAAERWQVTEESVLARQKRGNFRTASPR